MGIDPVTHRRRTDLDILSSLPSLLAAANLGNLASAAPSWDINALRLQANAAQLAKVQVMQNLIHLMSPNTSPTIDAMSLLSSSSMSLTNNNQFGDLLQLNRQLEAVLNGSLSLAQDSITMPPSNLPSFPSAQAFSNQQGYYEQLRENYNAAGVKNQVITTASSTPSLVSASPGQDQVHSHDVSTNSSASTQFDAWENLNPDDDFGWKDILE